MLFFVTEPKKEKTDGGASQNGALSPNGDNNHPSHITQPQGMGMEGASAAGCKPERPSTLGHGKLTRRLLCYHSEHCKYYSNSYFITYFHSISYHNSNIASQRY